MSSSQGPGAEPRMAEMLAAALLLLRLRVVWTLKEGFSVCRHLHPAVYPHH